MKSSSAIWYEEEKFGTELTAPTNTAVADAQAKEATATADKATSAQPQKPATKVYVEEVPAVQIEEVHLSPVKERFASCSRQFVKDEPESPALVPEIFADISKNFMVYFLILVLCALALFKVYQVQQTRLLTAQLNEVRLNNEDLQRHWLALTSERQVLSEHSRVRQQAQQVLAMQAPATDAELMIALPADPQ
ncbi:MAG: cell division protein FtsL [Candidatus Anaerobiospirillum merdipullorum]|uniref:Cell division protein FtsL n=1 Tax=Candidatus Anaerobiospirillum merdipullorum TaxID=2838450 RepID=A0A9E2KLM1_9GAMM|nr:cell division protein FtsL [Candidatus Anaerobiospirillum merdipullorum]